jgi:hypothetical protein
MRTKVTIEIDVKHEAIVRRALALAEEMEQLALTAADGNVVHDCEALVIEKGRRLQAQILEEAVAQRIEVAEKKGRLCVPVPADARKKTAVPKNAIS